MKNFSNCVDKLDIKCDGGGMEKKFDGGVTGQSTTSTPWKFDASRRNSTALRGLLASYFGVFHSQDAFQPLFIQIRNEKWEIDPFSVVRTDEEEQDDNHCADGGHDITRPIPDNVLHLQRRLLAVLPALNLHGTPNFSPSTRVVRISDTEEIFPAEIWKTNIHQELVGYAVDSTFFTFRARLCFTDR